MLYEIFFKRLFDFMIAILVLPFVLIVVAIISIIMLFFDKGSIFYISQRIGQNGKIFNMIKFRTMIVNAPDIRLEDGSTFNSDNDPRVTKFGKFLRKTSIDELPQIYNVIVGSMSFIGPRPDPTDWLERYTEEEKLFLKVKPGISGYNQAYFRNSADGAAKLKNDLYYARNISILLDVKIFFKTIRTILFRENIFIDESRQ
jgi:undecaprenyl phosphate N,N'-diacetylbacillosamine 1-phosphate transferase